MRARKYTYIPNAEIESITTWNGKEIPGSKLLDGAYARGKIQYGDGGMTSNPLLRYEVKYWETEEDRDMGESYVYGDFASPDKAEDVATRLYNKNGFACVEVIKKDTDEVILHISGDVQYENGGMMARGGYASRHRKRTLEEKAQEMYGSDWFDLDERTRKELIDDLRITKGEKGLIVGDKYVATFTLANGKTIKKSYSTKDELDEGIGDMYMDNDVIDVKIEETKAKEEPKEEKKGIFKLAKITEKTTSKGKEKRQGVAIEGIESDISRYEELKAIMKNAKAESDLIGGRIKEVGSQKWLELYEQSGTNPNSIDLIDGDETIMLQVKDGYKKVEPEKRAILQENYPDLLETTIVYTMDTALLDKYGEVITNLINNSKDIEEKDKDKLVKGESTTIIKKGSIDKILNYPNPEEVFILIEPTMALY